MPASAALDPACAQYLTGPDGAALLATVAALPGAAPEKLLGLRKRAIGADLAAAAIDLHFSRLRARGRFPEADRLFFTAETLAQATSPLLAQFHAHCFAGSGVVADLGCGVGIDSLALARSGQKVVAIERDPARLIYAQANARICGVEERITFVEGDVTTVDWHGADSVFWDPARRTRAVGGRGAARVSRQGDLYEPPLSFLPALQQRAPRGGCAKLSPALPDSELRDLGGSLLFLSEARACKEACFLFGEVAAQNTLSAQSAWAAVLLPEGLLLPGAPENAPIPAHAPPGNYVFDPDPALVRAGALAEACERLRAHPVSAVDSYLTGDSPPPPDQRRLASVYRLLDSQPYRPRALGRWLRERGFGRAVVKKRRFDREPDAVARELGLPGVGNEITLILVYRGEEGHLALICEPEAGL